MLIRDYVKMEAETDDRTHGCDGVLSHVELAPDRRRRRPHGYLPG
jgi:hypothetical protein